MTAPTIKGWCPGAHKPMMSGDGLVVRVRPFFGELSASQVIGLCDLSETFGSGLMEVTSRANLQIRGVAEVSHAELLSKLDDLGVIDSNPEIEARRNILMPSDWAEGDLTHRLYKALIDRLPDLPTLPNKVGFAIDTSSAACLTEGSADFRIELDEDGELLLRLDGCAAGRPTTEADVADHLAEMVDWFVQTGGCEAGRVSRHVRNAHIPPGWASTHPRRSTTPPNLGPANGDTHLGVPLGKLHTQDLRTLMVESGATRIRLMLNRRLLLKDAEVSQAVGFETRESRLMDVHACVGVPFCPQATVETIETAIALATVTQGSLHVSGCSKSCALSGAARTTLVGHDGQFNLVLNGRACDAAHHRGFDPTSDSDLALLL